MDRFCNIQLFLAVSPQQLNAISLGGWQLLPHTHNDFCQPQSDLAQAQQQAKTLYQGQHGAAYVVKLCLKQRKGTYDDFPAPKTSASQQHLSSQDQAKVNQLLSGNIELASAFNTECQSEISHDEFMFLYG